MLGWGVEEGCWSLSGWEEGSDALGEEVHKALSCASFLSDGTRFGQGASDWVYGSFLPAEKSLGGVSFMKEGPATLGVGGA